ARPRRRIACAGPACRRRRRCGGCARAALRRIKPGVGRGALFASRQHAGVMLAAVVFAPVEVGLCKMRPIKSFFVVALVLPLALWWWAAAPLPQPLTYFSFRALFVQGSGIAAIAAMSLALLLALRPRWLEPHLRGLDKMYRLHKWLGITALVVG